MPEIERHRKRRAVHGRERQRKKNTTRNRKTERKNNNARKRKRDNTRGIKIEKRNTLSVGETETETTPIFWQLTLS